MFEWFFEPLRWIQSNTNSFFQPYMNMGTVYWIVCIGVPIIYGILTYQHIKQTKEEQHDI